MLGNFKKSSLQRYVFIFTKNVRKRVDDGTAKQGTDVYDEDIPNLPESSPFKYIWTKTYRWNPETVKQEYNDEYGYMYQFFADILIAETLNHS
jgi:hypothetical protein